MEQYFISKINDAFDAVDQDKTKLVDGIFGIDGMSGRKTRIFYNTLMDMNIPVNYLEIGTWKGSTFVSAMYKNTNVHGYALDDFTAPNISGTKQVEENIRTFLTNGENCTIIKRDCFNGIADELKDQKIQVYMYDAGHTEEDHQKSLTHYIDIMDDIFVFIVDDWNHAAVRNGTYYSMAKSGVKVLYEKEIRYTWDDKVTPLDIIHNEFWNGMYVAVLKKI